MFVDQESNCQFAMTDTTLVSRIFGSKFGGKRKSRGEEFQGGENRKGLFA